MPRRLARCCRRLPPPRPHTFSARFHKVGVQFATVNSYEIIPTSKSMSAGTPYYRGGRALWVRDCRFGARERYLLREIFVVRGVRTVHLGVLGASDCPRR